MSCIWRSGARVRMRESIVSRFNAQLRGMIADHTYHRLLHVDWIRADINGDGIPEYVPQSDSTRSVEPQQRVRVLSAAHADCRWSPDHDPAALLHRRQHLHRLGHRAEPLQGGRSATSGSQPVDGEHLPVLVVIGLRRPTCWSTNSRSSRSSNIGLLKDLLRVFGRPSTTWRHPGAVPRDEYLRALLANLTSSRSSRGAAATSSAALRPTSSRSSSVSAGRSTSTIWRLRNSIAEGASPEG